MKFILILNIKHGKYKTLMNGEQPSFCLPRLTGIADCMGL